MRSPRSLAASSLLSAHVLAACAPAAPDRQPPSVGAVPGPRAVHVTLIDSIPYGDGMTEGTLRRVVVSGNASVDTVPGTLVADRPVIAPDGVVYGIRAEEDLAVGLFAYDVATRQVRTLPTPAGWWAATAPQLSPDGRHVAYLAQDAAGESYAAVAALPSGTVIYRGPPALLLETGGGVDEIRWLDAHRVEILIHLTAATPGVQRVRGTVAPLVMQVDTLRAAPPEHEAPATAVDRQMHDFATRGEDPLIAPTARSPVTSWLRERWSEISLRALLQAPPPVVAGREPRA